uniref:Pre-mRNA-splicing factor SPF27 n=1 Tax=Globisporangium ultimum (strain ATCC 200006 / CBS 805.95 / DAOM BR144) TaxID=431595 RepID=K3WC95_GLOUD
MAPPMLAPTTCPLLLEGRTLIDSLGYVDTELDDSHTRSVVQQLIRAEMTKFAPSTQDYLAFLPDYTPEFRDHPRLQSEYKRVKASIPLDAIDMNRYQVRAPTGKLENDVAAWEASINQLKVQLEHQNNRVTNLELQQAYGTKLWKVKAAVLDGLNAQYAHVVQETKAASEAINVKRKQDQVLNATKLQSYRRKYLDLLDKNDSIKRACDAEERRLRKKMRVE